MGLRMNGKGGWLALGLVSLLVAGCSGMGGSGSSTPEPGAQGLTQAEIRTILEGKSWRWKGPTNTGTTLYAADGTSLVEVDGKGTTKGKWMTKDGQLCESFDPAPWLPGGVPMSCYPFARGTAPGTYQAGKAVFTQAS